MDLDQTKYAANPEHYNKGPNTGDSFSKGTHLIHKDPLDKDPDLRRAKCDGCSNTAISRFDLPYFQSKPGETFDLFYCGHFGWD